MAQSVKTQLLHGVVWNFIEKVLMKGASFVIGIILARLLTPSDFGLVGMLSIFIAISNVFIEGGLAKALIQRQNCHDIDFSTAFVTNVVMSLVIYAILFVSAPWIASFYHEPILVPLTRVLSINFILGAFNIVQRAKLMAAVDFKSLAQINVISVIVSGLVGIGMAYWGCGVWSLVGQALSATLVLMIMFPFYSKWEPSVKFSKNSFRELFGFGSKLMITGVYSTIVNNISTLCIGRVYKSDQLGHYTRAQQFSDIISITLYEVLGNVTFPVLSELQNDKEKLVAVYRKSLYFTALVVFPVMLLLALVARPMVLLLLTEKWLPCVVLMQWLFLARAFMPLSAINMNILNAVGRSDLFLKLDLSKLPLTILVLWITIPRGVEAITIGVFLESFICFFINSFLPGRMFGYGAWAQIRDWKGILVSAAIMSGVVWGFLRLFSNIWVQFIGGVLLGLGVYIGCCFLFKVIDDDFWSMLNSLKRKKASDE